MRTNHVWTGTVIVLCCLLAACRLFPSPSPPTPTSTPTLIPTLPTETSTPSDRPTPCTLDAAFLEDVTIPDGTEIPPGEGFVKVWRVQIGGTCSQPRGLELIFESGDMMGGPASLPLGLVMQGQTLDVNLELTAPTAPGTYRSYWRLRDATGVILPLRLYVSIIVPGPTPTTAVHLTPSPPPVSIGPVIAVLDGADHLWFLNPNGDILPPGDMGPVPVRPGYGMVQGLGNGLYYLDTGSGAVMRLDLSGGLETAYDPETGKVTGFALAPDGERLAVTIEESVGGNQRLQRLYIVPLGGGLPDLVTADTHPYDPHVLVPVRWTPDGDLLYARQLYGIGGYLIFNDLCSLYRYDPETRTTETLIPAEEMHAPCVGDLSPNSRYLAHVCSVGTPPVMLVRDLTTRIDTPLPSLPEQNMVGSGRFSPSSAWLAYAVARGEPMDEAGWVAVASPDGTVGPEVVAEVEGGYLEVLGWLDDRNILLQQWGPRDAVLITGRGWDAPPMVLGYQLRFVAVWTP